MRYEDEEPTGPAVSYEDLKRRNELILNAAGEGIYGLDSNGFTTFVNPAASRLTGFSHEEMLGFRNHDIVHHSREDGSHYPREECPIYAAIKDGLVHTSDDEVFWRKDGTSFPVEYTSTPIRDDNGQLEGAVVMFRDITERKEQEAALNRALDEISSLKDQLEAENTYLREEIDRTHNFEDIVGDTPALKTVLHRLEQVAESDATVLILGESGTGKELFARAVHNRSQRHDRALVKVNCAALPPTLIESELFGHEKGAFTGALARRVGRFELADGGTIFLDEIGDLPLELQAKLLRVLQEGEFERLGDTKTIHVDVRVIAATNRDLETLIADGKFREDLYYRLNVVPLNIPALRDRNQDILTLSRVFVDKFSRTLGKSSLRISEADAKMLAEYHWPGNVRELENTIQRAVILSRNDRLVFERLSRGSEKIDEEDPLTLNELERQHILRVLKSTSWRVDGKNQAAEKLGINASTLRSRMKKLGIRRPI